MPRTKGSKNKPKSDLMDFTSSLAEKEAIRKRVTGEIETITANIESLKAELKEKKAILKSADKEIAKLEQKKKTAEEKVAEEAKKAEAEAVLKKLLADGMSAEEILAKLK